MQETNWLVPIFILSPCFRLFNVSGFLGTGILGFEFSFWRFGVLRVRVLCRFFGDEMKMGDNQRYSSEAIRLWQVSRDG